MKNNLIKNYRSLAVNKERKAVLNILQCGLDAVKTDRALKNKISIAGNKVKISGKDYDLDNYEKIFVIGFGKASFAAAKYLEKILGEKISGGAVIDVASGKLKRIKSFKGTHPLPSGRNLRATAQIVAILKQAGPKDLVIAVISGGGSALLFWPHSMRLEGFACVTDELMRSGAAISEMNTLRKHLSAIQGGHLISLTRGAEIVGLVFSDVPGDDVEIIASGPTVRDSTTVNDAKKIIEKYFLRQKCRIADSDLIETPKDENIFKNVRNIMAVNNGLAVRAMAEQARRMGFKSRIFSTALSGEAREIGNMLCKTVRRGEVLIAAGETTVTVTGRGKGGRNQELVLGAYSVLPPKTVIASLASDGRDNGPAAGAIMDGKTVQNAVAKKLDAKRFLAENNSSVFFEKTHSQIKTGITGVNVADLVVVLRS